MTDEETKPSKLKVWGNSMLNKCSSVLRNRRKRCASKKRRLVDRKRIDESQ